MATISYGISKPKDVLEKLQHDANELKYPYNPHYIFNFIVTAYSLSQWIEKYYHSSERAVAFKVGKRKSECWKLPKNASEWVEAKYLPTGTNYEFHIKDVLSICNHSANASKHYCWKDSGSVRAILENPPISNWYQWAFQSRTNDLFVNIEDRNYSFNQIKNIVIQFYTGLISHYDFEDSQIKVLP